jgi:hypothetical protein
MVCFIPFIRLSFEVKLILTMSNPVYLISIRAHDRCDRSAEDAYSSEVPDPTLHLSRIRVALHLDFAFVCFIMFDALLTLLFY